MLGIVWLFSACQEEEPAPDLPDVFVADGEIACADLNVDSGAIPADWSGGFDASAFDATLFQLEVCVGDSCWPADYQWKEGRLFVFDACDSPDLNNPDALATYHLRYLVIE